MFLVLCFLVGFDCGAGVGFGLLLSKFNCFISILMWFSFLFMYFCKLILSFLLLLSWLSSMLSCVFFFSIVSFCLVVSLCFCLLSFFGFVIINGIGFLLFKCGLCFCVVWCIWFLLFFEWWLFDFKFLCFFSFLCRWFFNLDLLCVCIMISWLLLLVFGFFDFFEWFIIGFFLVKLYYY